ncbi:MAG: hypothetical protein C0485_09420 [Pirellula sp.]|nr:hypothetical protein [Pirellula sp.]
MELRAADVTVFGVVAGRTPETIGYNSAHFMPGSNAAAWWKYSGVNGARVWATPSIVEGNDDNALFGDGVGSQQQFLDRRATLRSDPLNAAYVNWPYFENRYANNPTSGNIINLKYAFGELHDLGADPVVEIHRTNAAYPFAAAGTPAGWGSRWEQWQHFYAQAFYLAKNFDVRRYQMYNEPNHSSNSISQAEYIERLQLASDAVQSAIADVNSLYGKSLIAQLQGPVTAGGLTLFNANPGGDARDDATGWGEIVMDNLHTNFLGQVDPNFQLIQTYAYQQYNAAGTTFATQLAGIQSLVAQAAGGTPMRTAITEFNVHTAANFDAIPETLDSPSKFSRLGAIFTNLANEQPEELYVFKFGQTADDSESGVKKNGVHFVDNGNAPYNVGGVTKGGEVVRLFAKGFAGAHELMQLPAASGSGASDLQLAAAHDAAAGKYSLLSANESTGTRSINLNVNSWNVAPGAVAVVEEVSATSQGEVRQLITVPESGILALTQPAQSVLLVSIPEQAPAYRVTLAAIDDAMVKAGTNANGNFGTSPNLYAKNEPINAAARNVSFIKFDLGAIPIDSVEQAVLRLHGENDGSAAQVIAHVYGIVDDAWDESTITWSNAPNLADTAGPVNDISHNFIEGIGESATVLGHLTGTHTSRELMLDVTSFVREHPDQKLSILIAREVRFDGENVDDDLASLKLASKERGGEFVPQLLLSLNAMALPADFDGNGFVDGDDLTAWQNGFGTLDNADRSMGDANADGDVDGGDYLMWQQSYGTSVAPTSPPVTASVPEPSSLAALVALSPALMRARRQLIH